jgi:hypothetical protein
MAADDRWGEAAAKKNPARGGEHDKESEDFLRSPWISKSVLTESSPSCARQHPQEIMDLSHVEPSAIGSRRTLEIQVSRQHFCGTLESNGMYQYRHPTPLRYQPNKD